MPILLLGLVFAIGLIIYYIFITNSEADFDQKDVPGTEEDENNPFEEEENVIFLPDDIESIKEKYKKKK